MKKTLIVVSLLVILTSSVFAGLGLEFGLNPFANSMDYGVRAGISGGFIYSSKDNKLLVNIANINLLPSIESTIDANVMNLYSGILYSFVEPIYTGLRVGIRGCPDGNIEPDPQVYNTIVLRAQKLKNGLSYFVETEISIGNNNNKFTVGLDYKF